MNNKLWIVMALALGVLGWAAMGMSQGTNAAAAFIDAAKYNTKDSASCGIQEAIDALPTEGGTVMIPPGTHILHRPIFMKPHSKLVGAGRSTVLKKDAAFILKITEDAKKGQDYIVVEDASKLRVGACIASGDKNFHPNIGNVLVITNIAGNKVYFHLGRYRDYRTLQWDLAVERGACVMNLFVLVVPNADTVVMDMELDGNAAEQHLDFLKTAGIFEGYGMLWSGIYPAQGKVERCWIHDCGIGVHVNSLTGIEIRNCEVYRNTGDGIHVGGGPHSMIVNNRIYDNGAGAGVSFCYGNRKLIITGNEIMRNLAGIYCMGNGEAARDTTADRYTIVSQNIIYENWRAGLASGQGNIGPQDFVFTGNILQNNQQEHYRREAPAGIMFDNPQRCVIANNRCFDDREVFPRYVLAKPVAAGESNISLVLADRNVHSEPAVLTNDWLKIGTGSTVGVYAVMSVSKQAIQINPPVPTNLPADTPVARVAAQKWGIAILGKEAKDNTIIGNVCVGNGSGGILIKGLSNNVVANNAGAVVIYDDAKLPIENYFPALATETISNGGFETDTDWQLAKDLSAYDNTAGVAHSGQRALKLTRPAGKGVSDAIIPAFPIQPNCRYRLKAWVRSNARTANGDVFLPYLFLYSNHEKSLGWFATPLGYAEDPGFTGKYKWEALKWIQVGMEFQTGPQDTAMKIYCRLDDRCTGEGWVDDITLELIEQLAPSAGNLAPAKTAQ